MADNNDDDLLARIRATIDLMVAITNSYEEGDITREEAAKQLTELEADVKVLDPNFPIQNAAATLDEVDLRISGISDYYESSEYLDYGEY
jgi:hypothetical protein